MKIILSRHGNTFDPGDPVVCAGLQNDLPLVKKGLEQAERFASYLIKNAIRPAAIYCSALQRTAAYADIIIQKLTLSFQPIVDVRLNEIDYGDWTGLTNDEICKRFGKAALHDWEKQSQWPTNSNWGSSADIIINEVHAFIADLKQKHQPNDQIVVISSNGRLRYFLTLIENEFEKRLQENSFKVKTGHICQINDEKGQLQISAWNSAPE